MTTNTNDGSVIITNDMQGCETGVVTFWKLPGEITLGALTEAWRAQGLDEQLLPESPSAEVALSRAVSAQTSKRRNVEPLARRGDWAIVSIRVVPDGSRLKFRQEVRVKLDPHSTSTHPFTVTAIEADPDETAAIAAQINVAYAEARDILTSTDVSRWLTRLAMSRSGTCLRDSGGVYFVPRENAEFWRAVDRALRTCTEQAKVYKLPAMMSDEAVEMILDALVEESERKVKVVVEAMEQEGAQAPSACVLRNHAERCTKVLNKVAAYEDLLGRALPALTERLTQLRAGAVAASFLADAREQEAKAPPTNQAA